MKLTKNEYVEEQGPILEPDIYPATLTGFGEIAEGQFGPRLVWQFEIDDDGVVIEAAAFSSYSTAAGKKKSNLIRWGEALTGGELPDEFDFEDWVGKPCRVDVENYTKESGIVKNKVTDVRPAKKGQKGAGKARAPKDETDLTEADFEDLPF